MNKHSTIYRPIWTCGRYHKESHSAIMYNLMAGYAFFFEDYSADVVGIILEIGRNGSTNLAAIEKRTGIAEESLVPFIEQLIDIGLISDCYTGDTEVNAYRAALKNTGIRPSNEDHPFEQLTVAQNDAEKAYLKRAPILIGAAMFELTYNCSEKCIHCYNPGASRNDLEASHRNRTELLFDDYKRIIDDLYDNGLFKVCLTGGDPFSKAEVWKIIEYLYSKDIAIEIFTNGQRLLGKEDKLANFFPSDVGISLYGPNATIHDSITRIPGSYEKSIKVIKALNDFNIPVAIKCSLMRNTVKHYIEMYELAEQVHADLQLECRLFDGLDGDTSVTQNLRLTEEQLSIVVRDPRNPYYVGKELPEYGAIPQDMDHIACRAGVKNCCITPEGFMIPCCSYHAKIGNVQTSSIRDILYNNEEYKKLLSMPLSAYKECGKHEYCSFCKMCPGLNFSEHGTPLEAAENNCYIAKIRYNVATRLANDDDPLQGKELNNIIAEWDEKAIEPFSRRVFCSHLNKELTINNFNNTKYHESNPKD